MTTTRLSLQYGAPELLVYCFAHLDPRLKAKFDELVSKRTMDKVLWRMVQEGLFPEWFKDCFDFDQLYGQSAGMRTAMAAAVRDGLMRMDGTRLDYHLIDLDPNELLHILKGIDIDELSARRIELELNKRLLVSL